MENFEKLESRARQWLINKVDAEKTWTDFKIVKTNDVTVVDRINTIRFCFQCQYTWTLNRWPKNVDKEIYVIYYSETDDFQSSLL